MGHMIFAIPGDLATLTGGYAYARAVIRAWEDSGHSIHHIRLPDGFPDPGPTGLDDACQLLAAVPEGATVLVDGLAYGVLPAEFLRTSPHRWIALVHHPLALETGLTAERQQHLQATEHQALAEADHVVVTSPATARELATGYAVPAERITVALPGVAAAGRAVSRDDTPCLLSVGTLTRRKGYDVLIAALAGLRDLDWRCRIVGSTARDPAVSAKIFQAIREAGLEARIDIVGELSAEDLTEAYLQADMFVLASRYEGYGMVFAEAMAHGLPVIACRAGAVPETVPDQAGLLVPPDDPPALADSIRLLLQDSPRRRELAEGAWTHGQTLARWPDTAKLIADILEQVE